MSGDNKPGRESAKCSRLGTRRTFLKATATGAALTSMAGCQGNLGGGGDTLMLGATVPESGPYGEIGLNQRDGIELAVEHVNDEGNLDRDVEVEFADTQTEPDVGRRRAQELIDNGAEILVGNFSSSVALSIGDLAQRQGVIYICVGGSNAITGEKCKPNVFNAGNSAVQQTSGGLRYVLDEGLGESVYELSADYSWGQSIQNWNETQIAPEFDAEYLGNTFTELGQDDYSSELTTAADSGADIISFNHFASDHVTSANQAAEFGILDDFVCVWPATGIIEAAQIGQDILSHENFYASAPWYWEHDAPDAQEFADAFKEAYGERPLGFTASIYAGLRTCLNAVADTGTTDAGELRSGLEGKELTPQLWNVGERFRECDHRATISTFTVKGRPASEVKEQNYFEIINVPQNPEESQMRTCEQTGCTF